MSWNPAIEPGCPDEVGVDAIETLIVPRSRDLGGFEVRRALPAPKRQMVGPFIFFDQAGPAELLTGQGIDVRPHPHIGLGTVTYLFRGDFHHRDSTGADQIIRPGALNWMVAGRGVSHSERTSVTARQRPEQPVRDPDLAGAARGARGHGARIRASRQGDAADDRGPRRFGPAHPRQRLWQGRPPRRCSPRRSTPTSKLEPGRRLPMPDDHEDRGIYIVEGSISIAGQDFEAPQMMVFRPGDRITVAAGERGARLMILGGATLERAALHLVELRRLLAGADRGSQGRMARTELGTGPF